MRWPMWYIWNIRLHPFLNSFQSLVHLVSMFVVRCNVFKEFKLKLHNSTQTQAGLFPFTVPSTSPALVAYSLVSSTFLLCEGRHSKNWLVLPIMLMVWKNAEPTGLSQKEQKLDKKQSCLANLFSFLLLFSVQLA